MRRGDPWLRPLEALIVALWWWHPVAWWARRNFRAAEERACDAWVIRRRPDRARDYAEALVAAAAFLVPPRPALPALATGFGVRHLKERLIMILDRTPERPIRRGWIFLAGTAAGLALLIAPTTGVPAATPEQEAPPVPPVPRAVAATPAPAPTPVPAITPRADSIPVPAGRPPAVAAPTAPRAEPPRLATLDEFHALEEAMRQLDLRRAELQARLEDLVRTTEEQTRTAEEQAREAAELAEVAARIREVAADHDGALEAQTRAFREAAEHFRRMEQEAGEPAPEPAPPAGD